MPIYTIHLDGPAVVDARLPGPLVRELLEAVERGTRGAVRLRLEGRSAAKGPAPRWLNEAAAFDIVAITTDVPGVRLQAPMLRETLPERFAQIDLFGELSPDATGLTLLSDSLADALGGREDSDAFANALLDTFESSFRDVLRAGVDAVEIRNGRPSSPVVQVTLGGIRNVEELSRRTPAPRRVRLAGQIDAIRYSDRGFTLVLPGSRPVRGVLVEGAPETLAPMFGQTAVISGIAHYRPSGALLRVDAERIVPGEERDLEAWGMLPLPAEEPQGAHRLRTAQGPRTGLNALFGEWRDEADEEEVFRVLREVS